jgi:hypothetical protein
LQRVEEAEHTVWFAGAMDFTAGSASGKLSL